MSRTLFRDYRHYQLPGLGLDAPWWVVPLILAIGVVGGLVVLELLR